MARLISATVLDRCANKMALTHATVITALSFRCYLLLSFGLSIENEARQKESKLSFLSML